MSASAIDLRSDTVTRPTTAMRAAMAAAEVGDDQFGEDPTINALQERIAALLGKEAALWMLSGTMANQAALRLFTRPGDDVIVSRHRLGPHGPPARTRHALASGRRRPRRPGSLQPRQRNPTCTTPHPGRRPSTALRVDDSASAPASLI